jgi:hypothetical protein
MTSINREYKTHKKKSNFMNCSFRILNNAWTLFINNALEWFALCFINKEWKKYEWKKMMYSEICAILSYDKKFQIISLMKIQYEKSNLTYYSKKKNSS